MQKVQKLTHVLNMIYSALQGSNVTLVSSSKVQRQSFSFAQLLNNQTREQSSLFLVLGCNGMGPFSV